MKTPGGWTRRASRFRTSAWALEHAKHDRGNKSECHIRGNNAQSADQSHAKPPGFTSLPALTLKLAGRSIRKKSALLSISAAGTAANVVKDS
jgi:hypothetical protein